MIIKEITLVGYKRMSLNGIKTFHWKPTSTLCRISGPNGSGKSSLLEALTPLPAIPADYVKGGSKEIVIEHEGLIYKLTSKINGSGKHSFIRDSEELNPGGTGVIQKELVEFHLGFTTKLQDILTGNITFSSMSPSKRREWITELCQTDYSYAMGVFKQIQSNTRDVQGALKLAKSRLVQETSKLLDQSQLTDIQERAKLISEQIHVFLESKEATLPSVSSLSTELRNQIKALQEHCERFFGISGDISQLTEYNSLEDLTEALTEYKNDRVSLHAELKAKSGELLTLTESIDRLTVNEHDTLDIVRAKRELKAKQLDELNIDLRYDLSNEFNTINNTHTTISVIANDYKHVVSLFKVHPYTGISIQNVEELEKKIVHNQTELNRLTNRLERVQTRIQHIKESKDQQCPKCSYVYKPGISENELNNLEIELKGLLESKNQLTEEIKLDTEKMDEGKMYYGVLNRFRRLVNAYPVLNPLWNVIIEKCYYETSPVLMEDELHKFKIDVSTVRDKLLLEQDIGELDKRIEVLSELNVGALTDMQDRKVRIEKEVESISIHLAGLDTRIELLTKLSNTVNRFYEAVKITDEMISKIEKTRNILIRSIRSEELSKDILDAQTKLASMQSVLNESNQVKTIIEMLEGNIKEMEITLDAYVLLGKALSPTNGLIADQMIGFIKALTSQMNNVIKQLWEYDLEIQPCANENGELDYKFPLTVESERIKVPDCSKGSEGQRDVIDFVFVLMVMLYKDLQDYPLYMDETGASFDVNHRQKLLEYIKLLVSTKQTSTIFLINHYASFSGALHGAEVVLLNKDTIGVTETVNENVRLT